MKKDEKAWYLVYTKPSGEYVAQENLKQQGYQVYLPLHGTTRRRRGRYVTVIEPMFLRYLFINLNQTTDNWSPIRSTLGVTSIVRFGAEPAQVPYNLIVLLQQNQDEEGLQRLVPQELKCGDSVRIIDGVMAGYTGIYKGRTSKERALVLLDIVGQHTQVSISRHNLQSA